MWKIWSSIHILLSSADLTNALSKITVNESINDKEVPSFLHVLCKSCGSDRFVFFSLTNVHKGIKPTALALQTNIRHSRNVALNTKLRHSLALSWSVVEYKQKPLWQAFSRSSQSEKVWVEAGVKVTYGGQLLIHLSY